MGRCSEDVRGLDWFLDVSDIHMLINTLTCALKVLTYKQAGVDTRVFPQQLFTHVDGRIIVVLHTEQNFILRRKKHRQKHTRHPSSPFIHYVF